ncbi:Annexin [Macrolepiota fuliginosa MF-IS2]|uniref:Annexin n=1 Tax=Macrolepiota fuliginosa MF-IS2 TaxID=1400762 RepID=A0A9P5XB83_9AGAR|nr:Annexin [Macrolepiota fuliginosa MF-IS2]
MSREIHNALYSESQSEPRAPGSPAYPQIQVPEATTYPSPVIVVGPAPGFPTSPASPVPHSPYQPSRSPQFNDAQVVYSGILVPNPEAPPAPSGTMKVPGYFPENDYALLKSAKKGKFGVEKWDEEILLRTLVDLNAHQIDAVSDYCSAMTGKTLAQFLPEKTRINSCGVIHALALGPLGYDVELARESTRGIGTDEDCLIELLCGHSNEDIEILKRAYTKRYSLSLEKEVKGDTSGEARSFFEIVLKGQRAIPQPIDYEAVERDVDEMHAHGLGRNTVVFCQVFINRTDAHIAAVIDRYGQKHTSLSKAIKACKTFNPDVKNALVYILQGVKTKRNKQGPLGAWRDAKFLERAVAAKRNKSQTLVYRIVRASWDPVRLQAIKEAYAQRYGKTLEERLVEDKSISGTYQTILLELIKKA